MPYYVAGFNRGIPTAGCEAFKPTADVDWLIFAIALAGVFLKSIPLYSMGGSPATIGYAKL